MSKAVLIMDMPGCCYDCPITVCDADNMSTERRSKNCPLRELPEKKPERVLKKLGKTTATTRFEASDLNIGWNACLDAITGDGKQ